ncbi:ABC transporter permease [Micromonosporaceae bacterium B7E4]
MTAPASVHPRTVDSLLPDAKALTARLGKTPTRNQLMKEFRIGAPKATALIEHLTARPAAPVYDYPEPIGPDPAPDTTPADDFATEYANGQAVRRARTGYPVGPVDYSLIDVAREVRSAVAEPLTTAKQEPQMAVDGHPGPNITTKPRRATAPARPWVLLLLAAPAFVAIWSGWVGLGGLTGFGVVHPLPGIWDSFSLNTAITLPIGVEAYAAYALRAWLSGRVPARARRFAKWSAIGSLLLGALGQVAYHLMESAGITTAPWWITTLVSCLPVIVLGMGAALAHLLHSTDDEA